MNKLLSFLFGKKAPPEAMAESPPRLEKLENLIIILAAKRAEREYQDAIRIYDRYNELVRDTDIELPALTSVIRIADEANDACSLLKYARRLKLIEPEHPYVEALSKRFIL